MKFPSITFSFPKEVILLKITCLAWLVAKIMSFKVWIIDRDFPVAPLFDFLSVPNEVHLFLFGFSLIGISSVFFFPTKKSLLVTVILLELFSCILDQMRWQPWEFQYLLTFAFFLFAKDKKHFLSLFAFLVATTYIFSGIHKFSGSFLYSFWDNVVLIRLLELPFNAIRNPFLHYPGLLLSIIEIGIGIGILLSRHKRYFSFLAILMHLIIILIFGPSGLHYNTIIFPWNLAMIALLWILFSKDNVPNFSISFFKSKFNCIVFLFIGIMPFFSLVGKWDQYLSFNLYSGNTQTLMICLEDTHDYPVLERYKSKVKTSKFCDKRFMINTTSWALEELKVPVYPEERVFRKLKEHFNKKYPDVENTFFYYWYPYKKENYKEVQ